MTLKELIDAGRDLLTRKEAAELLRLKPNTLAVWVTKGWYAKELPVVRLSQNVVRYARARARRMKRKHGLSLIVVDYLQLMTGRGEGRIQEIGGISRGLKALAKELEIPIIALAQLNRDSVKRDDKRPLMSELAESGSIEQDADIIAMLHRESYYRPDAQEWSGIAELLVRKNRQGPIGDCLLSWIDKESRAGGVGSLRKLPATDRREGTPRLRQRA